MLNYIDFCRGNFFKINLNQPNIEFLAVIYILILDVDPEGSTVFGHRPEELWPPVFLFLVVSEMSLFGFTASIGHHSGPHTRPTSSS